jgi:hypothetical protein
MQLEFNPLGEHHFELVGSSLSSNCEKKLIPSLQTYLNLETFIYEKSFACNSMGKGGLPDR